MNILMVAYYFPPKGGGGVQRTLKYVKYLSRMGHNVHVLTVESGKTSLENLELANLKNVHVYRTKIKEVELLNKFKKGSNSSGNTSVDVKRGPISKVKGSLRSITKKIILDIYNMKYMPDDKCGWIAYARETGLEIIKSKDIDIIYSTSAPYSSHLIAYELAKKSNIKWIADFRDPWANNQFVSFNPIIMKKHAELEAKVVQGAHKVVSVSYPIIKDFIDRYSYEDGNKFVVVPNGYDEEDFGDLNLEISDENEKFMLLYNGMIYGKRSPEKIMMAIDNLIKKDKIDRNKIELIFQGQIGNEHIGIIKHYKNLYPEIITYKKQVSHKESLKQLEKANALLLIIDEGKGSEGIYTGKLFEYLRSGKVILGVVPDGVAKSLIIDTKTGLTAHPSRIDEIEGIILKAYMGFVNKTKVTDPDYIKIEHYSRENLTKKLVEVMNV